MIVSTTSARASVRFGFARSGAAALLSLALVALPSIAPAKADREATAPRMAAHTSVAGPRAAPPPAPPVSISWLPEWLMTPISRAIADATDPRPRR